MSRPPCVVHFKCLDTMGLRSAARVIGAGQAGVRLTRAGLASYVRPSRATPAEEPAPEARETLAPSVAEVAPRGPSPSLVTIELGPRRPTIWAVAFLTIGVTFGAAIARVASSAGSTAATIAAEPPPAAEAPPAPVTWPRATRHEASPDPATLATSPSPSSPSSADLPPDLAHVPTAPARGQHSPSHAHRHAPRATPDVALPENASAAGSEDAEAAASAKRARDELVDAL